MTVGRVEIERREAPGGGHVFLVTLVDPDGARLLFHETCDYAEATSIAASAGKRFGPVRDFFGETLLADANGLGSPDRSDNS